MPINVVNRGRLINFVNGITGVSPGGNAVVNMPVNQRYHRIVFQCVAVNYTGGTGAIITKITSSAGAGATGTLTIVNGVPTAISIVAGGTGWTVGDTFSIADATGAGAVFTIATVTGGPPGAIATATVTVVGTPTPVAAKTLISSLKLLVNGVNMRDIVPDLIQRINIANGLHPRLGELAIYFTDPWRNVNQQNETTSWDTFGQSTFQIQIQISASVTTPGLTAIQEFDFLRNTRPGPKNTLIPFLQPVSQHSFSWPIVGGRNDINTLPFSFPISRMWLLGSSPGNITQVEVFQDGNKPFEATTQQLTESYEEYGFQFGPPGQPNYQNQNQSAAAIVGAYEPLAYFDAAFISDPDQRWWKALKVANAMILRVYSAIPQTLTIVQEVLPGSFSS